MNALVTLLLLPVVLGATAVRAATATALPQIRTSAGIVAGTRLAGIDIFRGIPYARPPVGERRWRAPQPAQAWRGVRSTSQFGPRCMQRPLYADMVFRSNGMSEDCLYLNVWTPAADANTKLPVLVYFYGGGLNTGDGSEPRYDGESLARQGIVVLTVNYRLNVFGFFAHPELTREAPYHASGNYGLLDQVAALEWVQDNIAAFGGDPQHVTIAGESAGSYSVSALMASPLSRDRIAGAIGSSGSLLAKDWVQTLAVVEQRGVDFAESLGAETPGELRSLPAEALLEATARVGAHHFMPNIDGHLLPQALLHLYEGKQQARVPLLVGWNSLEAGMKNLLGDQPATVDGFTASIRNVYGAQASSVLAAYRPASDSEAPALATELAGARAQGFSTWKWSELQAGAGQPVFRYYYAHPRPAMRVVAMADPTDPRVPEPGAVHSADIEYAMGNLPSNRVFEWTEEDYRVSRLFQSCYLNFVRTGNPNGNGVPQWPELKGPQPIVMQIDAEAAAIPDPRQWRYRALDAVQ